MSNVETVEWQEKRSTKRRWSPTNQFRWFLKADGQVLLQQLWTWEVVAGFPDHPDWNWNQGSDWRELEIVKETVPTLEQTIRTTILKEEAPEIKIPTNLNYCNNPEAPN